MLVRHGETEGESSIRYHGRNDVALSELGARADARGAPRDRTRASATSTFDHIFATPLSRATRERARSSPGATRTIVTVEDFIEVHFGLFEGLTARRSAAPSDRVREVARRSARAAYTYPEGESRAAFTERVERGLATTLN